RNRACPADRVGRPSARAGQARGSRAAHAPEGRARPGSRQRRSGGSLFSRRGRTLVADPRAAGTARPARLNQPQPALVEAGFDGSPREVNRRAVMLVREEWRVVDRWWTEEPVSRRYFDVVLESGENAVVFRDEEAGSWFSQRGA